MADRLAEYLADLANARAMVLTEMAIRYPVGAEVAWRAGSGFSTGRVVGHPPLWTRYPTCVQVENHRTRRRRWVTPNDLPEPSYG